MTLLQPVTIASHNRVTSQTRYSDICVDEEVSLWFKEERMIAKKREKREEKRIM
jgi:hypothetical protein